jgi:hypothetical protein
MTEQHPPHAERNAAALRQLRPGTPVGHVNPELADWAGTVATNGAGHWARRETGDVWVIWRRGNVPARDGNAGLPASGWISASAVTIEGICPGCHRPAHRVLPGEGLEDDRTPGWYHDSPHDRDTCWAGKAEAEARQARYPLPEQVGRQVRDIPRWGYQSDSTSVRGYGRLRVWETGDGGHLAVVTEDGSPVSVTNGAEHIWAQLAADFPGPLVVLEFYPEGQSGAEHVDQITGDGEQFVGWQPVYPPNVQNPRYEYLAAWLAEHGHLIPVSAS